MSMYAHMDVMCQPVGRAEGIQPGQHLELEGAAKGATGP